jgi:phosphoribosylformimino-5-aminoimidazole carboxamide ribotide isomerase
MTTRKTAFAPCVDLHSGKVKQIVGGTLTTTSSDLQTNFTSEHGAAYYAELYKKHNLRGGHVIMLGPGNDQAAREALAAWPGGLQVGGGIKDTNAKEWIEAGAEKVGFSFNLFIAFICNTICKAMESNTSPFDSRSSLLFPSHSNISSGS